MDFGNMFGDLFGGLVGQAGGDGGGDGDGEEKQTTGDPNMGNAANALGATLGNMMGGMLKGLPPELLQQAAQNQQSGVPDGEATDEYNQAMMDMFQKQLNQQQFQNNKAFRTSSMAPHANLFGDVEGNTLDEHSQTLMSAAAEGVYPNDVQCCLAEVGDAHSGIGKIVFHQNPFVTDQFIAKIVECLSEADVLDNVQEVDLSGCLQVTDNIFLSLEAFSSIQKVILNGCPRVTEMGLSYAMEEGIGQQRALISLVGCGSRIGVDPNGEDIEDELALLKTEGCPTLLNINDKEDDMGLMHHYSVTICRRTESTLDLLSQLPTDGLTDGLNCSCAYWTQDNPDRDHDKAVNYHLNQVIFDDPFVDLLNPSVPAVLIFPLHPDDDPQESMEFIQRVTMHYLFKSMASLGPLANLRKIVPVYVGAESTELKDRIDTLTKLLNDLSFDAMVEVYQDYLKDIVPFAGMPERLGTRGIDDMLNIMETLEIIVFDKENPKHFENMLGVFRPDLPEALISFHRRVLDVFDLLLTLDHSDRKVFTLDEVRQVTDERLGSYNNVYEAAMQTLHERNLVLFVSELDPPLVIFDLAWLMTLIKELSSANSKAGDHVTCLDSDTPLWQEDSVWSCSKAAKGLDDMQLQRLVDVLLSTNMLCRVHCKRESRKDPRYHLLFAKHLRDSPVTMSRFICGEETPNPDFIEVHVPLVFLGGYAVRQSVLVDLLFECTKVGPPLSMGRQGAVFHFGAAEIVIAPSRGEVNQLLVVGRCFVGQRIPRLRVAMRDYLWSIVHLFCDILEVRMKNKHYFNAFIKYPNDRPANRSVCARHVWSLPADSESPRFTVCALCGNCSSGGWSCHYNGLPSDRYRQCLCNTSQICCTDCGLCQSCVKKHWDTCTVLRPGGMGLMELIDKQSDMEHIPESDIEMRNPLNPLTNDTVEVLTLSPCSIVLKGRSQESMVKVFPGPAAFARMIKPYTPNDDQPDPMGLKVKIQIKPSEDNGASGSICSVEPVPSTVEHNSTFQYKELENLLLWHTTGVLEYRASGESNRSNELYDASICSQCEVQVGDFFEVELLSGTVPPLSLGIESTKLDVKSMFADANELLKSDKHATLLGCGVMQENGQTSVYFTCDGITVLTKPVIIWPFHAMIKLAYTKSKIRLLKSSVWRKNHEQMEKAFDILTNADIQVIPGQTLTFPRNELMFSTKQPSELHKSDRMKAFLHLKSNKKVPMAFKIKVTDPEKIVTSMSHGFLTEDNKWSVSVRIYLKATDSSEKIHIERDKLLLEYLELTDEQAKQAEQHADKFAAYMQECKATKLALAWGEPDYGLFAVEPVPQVSEGPPKQASYKLDVSLNGSLVDSVWVPLDEYTVAVFGPGKKADKNENQPALILAPRFPCPVTHTHSRFEVGMLVFAEIKMECLPLKGIKADIKECLQKGERFYLLAEVADIDEEKGIFHLDFMEGETKVEFQVQQKTQEILPWYHWNHLPESAVQGEEAKESLQNFLTNSLTNDTVRFLVYDEYVTLKLPISVDFSRVASARIFKTDHPFPLPSTANQLWPCQQNRHSYPYESNLMAARENEFKIRSELGALLRTTQKTKLFLPQDLDVETLNYPSLRHLFDVNKLDFHVPCKFMQLANEPIHFVDHPGVALTSIKPAPDFASVFGNYETAWGYGELAVTQVTLPIYEKLVPNCVSSQLRRADIESGLKRIVTLYAASWHLYTTKGEGSSDTFEIPCLSEFGVKEDLDHFHCELHSQMFMLYERVVTRDTRIPAGEFGPYAELLHSLDVKQGVVLHDDVPRNLPNLRTISIASDQRESVEATKLPSRISELSKLEVISLYAPNMSRLPEDISGCTRLSKIAIIPESDISELPVSLTQCQELRVLWTPCCLLKQLHDDFGALQSLQQLDLDQCPIAVLPESFGDLHGLRSLILGGSKPTRFPDNNTHEGHPFLTSHVAKYLGRKTAMELLDKCNISDDAAQNLELPQWADFNAQLYYLFPRLGLDYEEWDDSGGFPTPILRLTNLTRLHLCGHAFRCVPADIVNLTNLTTLKLSNSLFLETLPGIMGDLKNLKSIDLSGCPSLRTLPETIISRGTEAVKAYLRRLTVGYTENWRTKLMVVGLGGVGKTSLLRALMSGRHKSSGTGDEAITDGIDIKSWSVKHATGARVTFSTWDFAGQSVYYNTHQFFLSSRAVYLLLWTARNGYENGGLEFWLSSIQCHAPKTPVFIIGTHADKVSHCEIPRDRLQKMYPQICGFHYVSSIKGTGIAELEKDILEVTLKESYMGEYVPTVYLQLERTIHRIRKEQPFVTWKEMMNIGIEKGIYEEQDMKRAVQFLHDLGIVQYFDNDMLKDYVILDPQWIVDIMTRVVSVNDTPITQGRFDHKSIPIVWRDFPEELHDWLLKLTENFDLTFPVPGESLSLVPCLLPENEPPLSWTNLDEDSTDREFMLTYKFSYLPSGLFNRMQVRLCQFSDTNQLWKRGSFINKNGHRALIQQKSDQQLEVKVQGPRPENILFLIHEALESLISESFSGVHYDYSVPCPDCIAKCGVADAYKFMASMVRLAANFHAPFLQCQKYFHVISMAMLQALMPPSDSAEFEIHLEMSVQGLSQLRSGTSKDVFLAHCPGNMPSSESEHNHQCNPLQIVDELHNVGYSCWYEPDFHSVDVHNASIALQDAKVLIIFISDEFVKCDHCRQFGLHALESLNKPYAVVAVGKSPKWEQTHLGYRIGAQEVYIGLKDGKDVKNRVKGKMTEIKEKIKDKIEPLKTRKAWPVVFLSYCWSNSEMAVAKGTRRMPDALGSGDPRVIKQELEDRRLPCWIDIEQVGKRGLFEDITSGIRNAQVVVACVSKEYAKSANCMMELRFSVCNMKKPVVLVIVGQGDDWEETEIGMLATRIKAKKIFMQTSCEPSLFDTLAKYIRNKLPEDWEEMQHINKPATVDIDTQQISFKEEFELAQRKFQRHLVRLSSVTSTIPYPRLIIVDIMADQSSDTSLAEDVRPQNYSQESDVPATKPPKRRLTRLLSKHFGDIVDSNSWLKKELCIKILCENEEGWHPSHTVFPMVHQSSGTKESFIRAVAPYLARMYALLEHSSCRLEVNKKQNRDCIQFLRRCALDANFDMTQAYMTLQEQLMELDYDTNRGMLKRCYLPTGKLSWLCEEHQKAPHVRVLNDDVTASVSSRPLTTQNDLILKEYIDKHSHLREAYRTKKEKPPVLTRRASKLATEGPQRFLSPPSSPIPEFAECASKASSASTRRKPGLLTKKLNRQDVFRKVRVASKVASAADAFANPKPTSQACVLL